MSSCGIILKWSIRFRVTKKSFCSQKGMGKIGSEKY